MMLPRGAVPTLVVDAKMKAAPGPLVAGLNQQTFPAGQADKSFSAPGPRLARRVNPEPPPMAEVPEIVSGWPDCARVTPLNDHPPRAWPEKPLWFRKNGRLYV